MINNKQSMKLYTEEQVTELTTAAFTAGQNHNPAIFGVAFEKITPIELPIDEEIKEYINSTPYYGHCTPEYCEGIEDGIRWILTKIQGGNK